MPFSMVAGFMTQEGYTGSRYKNPYNFDNHNCKEFWYTVNNVDLPTRHYRPDWESLGYRKEYRITMDGLQGLGNSGSQLTEALFKAGMCLYSCDLSADSCTGFHRHWTDSGTMSLSGIFSEPTTENLTLVLVRC